jgi:hypothetical protein
MPSVTSILRDRADGHRAGERDGATNDLNQHASRKYSVGNDRSNYWTNDRSIATTPGPTKK